MNRKISLTIACVVAGAFLCVYPTLVIAMTNPRTADTQQLNYNKYVAVSISAASGDHVQWSFSSANPAVDITVEAMDASSYSTFTSGGSPVVQILSDGSKTADSGTFVPDYKDTYYIVFINTDVSHHATTLTYSAAMGSNFNAWTFAYTYWWVIVLAYFGVNLVLVAWMLQDMKHHTEIYPGSFTRIFLSVYVLFGGIVMFLIYCLVYRRKSAKTDAKAITSANEKQESNAN
ncbi:MAG TPA: hypothetical protein VKK79_03185 [Candidatus Lokiarchaeia archaeon]|nr:hypothetical protein [Candidatus Lokiarchaeia archaeon]